MKNVKKYKRGQGMTEYLIIVALIAVGTIGMVRTVGKNVQAGFGTVANALHGKKQKVETDAVVYDLSGCSGRGSGGSR